MIPTTRKPDGHEIRRLRKHAGLTQEELAKVAGLSPRTIQGLEAGRPAFPRSTIQPVADALKVPRKQLLIEEETPDPKEQLEDSGDPLIRIETRHNYDDFDETRDLPKLIKEIVAETPGISSIIVIRIRPGSVIIEVRMSEKDIHALVASFAEHAEAFDKLLINCLHIPPEVPFPISLVAKVFAGRSPPLALSPGPDKHVTIFLSAWPGTTLRSTNPASNPAAKKKDS